MPLGATRPAGGGGTRDPVTTRHNGGAVYALCDGHAKYDLNGKIAAPTTVTASWKWFQWSQGSNPT